VSAGVSIQRSSHAGQGHFASGALVRSLGVQQSRSAMAWSGQCGVVNVADTVSLSATLHELCEWIGMTVSTWRRRKFPSHRRAILL
jgi:hypothetical protein